MLPSNFCMTQSQSFVILFFLPHEVSDNKPGVDDGNNPPSNLVAFLQNLEILLVNAFVSLNF